MAGLDFQGGNVIRVTPVFLFNNESEIMNVYHVLGDFTGSYTFDAGSTALKAWVNQMYLPLASRMAPDITSQRIEFYDESAKVALGEVGWTDFVGTNATQTMPPGIAAQIDVTSSNPNVRGRKYLGPFTEVDHIGGIWGNDHLAALATYATGWLSDTVLSGLDKFSPQVWSKKLQTAYYIGDAVVQAVCAYQRRRKQGVGS